MSAFIDFFTNYFFVTVLVSWFTAVFLKGLIYFLRREPRFFSRAFANGGMPSTHSAFVASLSAAILLKTGQSAVFYLSALFAVVVMSDAIRLRKNLGEQGDNLNKLLLKFKQNPIRVVHGHSASQVLLGAAWGIVVAVVMFSIF